MPCIICLVAMKTYLEYNNIFIILKVWPTASLAMTAIKLYPETARGGGGGVAIASNKLSMTKLMRL